MKRISFVDRFYKKAQTSWEQPLEKSDWNSVVNVSDAIEEVKRHYPNLVGDAFIFEVVETLVGKLQDFPHEIDPSELENAVRERLVKHGRKAQKSKFTVGQKVVLTKDLSWKDAWDVVHSYAAGWPAIVEAVHEKVTISLRPPQNIHKTYTEYIDVNENDIKAIAEAKKAQMDVFPDPWEAQIHKCPKCGQEMSYRKDKQGNKWFECAEEDGGCGWKPNFEKPLRPEDY